MKLWTLIAILAATIAAYFSLKFAELKDKEVGRAHEMFMELARQGKLMPSKPEPKMENL